MMRQVSWVPIGEQAVQGEAMQMTAGWMGGCLWKQGG